MAPRRKKGRAAAKEAAVAAEAAVEAATAVAEAAAAAAAAAAADAIEEDVTLVVDGDVPIDDQEGYSSQQPHEGLEAQAPDADATMVAGESGAGADTEEAGVKQGGLPEKLPARVAGEVLVPAVEKAGDIKTKLQTGIEDADPSIDDPSAGNTPDGEPSHGVEDGDEELIPASEGAGDKETKLQQEVKDADPSIDGPGAGDTPDGKSSTRAAQDERPEKPSAGVADADAERIPAVEGEEVIKSKLQTEGKNVASSIDDPGPEGPGAECIAKMAEEESSPAGNLSGLAPVAGMDPPNRYGRCIHNLAEELGMEYQDYMWSPDTKITKDELLETMEAWGLEPPNLVLSVFGPNQPTLTYKESMKSPALKETISELCACRKMAKSGTWETPPEDVDITTDDGLHGLVTEKLTENLIQTLMSLLTACEQTNSWIHVAGDGVCFADYLVHEALRRCKARPVIIAVIGRNWFSDEVNAWKILDGGARKCSGKLESFEVPPVRVPIVLPNGYTTSWAPGYATHYFFVHNVVDTVKAFPIDWLGPAGSMFISGDGGCAELMNNSIRSLRPTLLVKHSGRSCDFFSFAAETLKTGQHDSSDKVMKAMVQEYPFWWNNDCVFGDVSSDRVPTFIIHMTSAYLRSPEHFRTSIVVLDAWKTTPDEALRQMSVCFANSSALALCGTDAGEPEAHEETLAMAWHLHRLLAKSAVHVASRVNFLSIAAVALSTFTTSLAVSVTYMQSLEREQHKDWTRWLAALSHWMMILLPAIAGFMLQILSRFHYMNKWGGMHMARQEIESEIFKFRANHSEYDLSGAVLNPSSKEAEFQTKSRARDIFAQRVTELFGTVFSQHLVDDCIHFGSSIYEKRKRTNGTDTKWGEFAKPLLDVDGHQVPVLGNAPLAIDKPRKPENSSSIWSKDDDGYSSLSGEKYFEHRTLPMVRALQADAQKLAQRLKAYELAILILSLVSTLFAALGLKQWIPITVALGTGLTSCMSYEALQSRVATANASLGELTGLVNYWSALGALEKRTRSVKASIVDVTEHAIMRQATAYVAGIAQSSFKETGNVQGRGSADSKAIEKGQKAESKIGGK